MMVNQQKLFQVADHSGRGLEFQREIAASNAFYLQKGVIDVVENANLWDFARGADWHKYKLLYDRGDRSAARTGDGRYLMRILSEVDFSGGNGQASVRFDCKESNQSNFPFALIKSHQFERLRRSDRCGGIAGFLIKMASYDRVFFLSVEKLSEAYQKWQVNRAVGRRNAKGAASFTLSELEASGVEIFKHKVTGLWDWITIIE